MPKSSGALEALLEASHYIVPDELPRGVDDAVRVLGALGAVMHLVDLDQRVLVTLDPHKPAPSTMGVDRTLAGRAFRQIEVVQRQRKDGLVLWVPMLDGTERVGVLQVLFPAEHVVDDLDEVRAYAGLVAELVMVKSAYGDFFECARRQTPLTVGADLLWQLLPPLTFATESIVITGVFSPTASLGGDAFDYGVNENEARVGIFDAVGHDLTAGLVATTAVAAYRNARRSGLDLPATATRIHETIRDHFTDSSFATGILLSLELSSGKLAWSVAGHPAPLLLRHGRVVKALDPGRGMPFGLGAASDAFTEQLEPGDQVLLYTDGVTEARDANGEFFGLETLVDLVGRSASTDPPPETMRQLMHAVEAHNASPLKDDATAVLIEWRGAGPVQLKV